jgi:prepilin-type N-terminal cleavage/methylation domain-containing protein
MISKNKKGFTLIELLVVVGIIGIVFAILVPNILRARDRVKNKSFEQSLLLKNGISDKSILDESIKKRIVKEEKNFVIPETISTDINVDLSRTNFVKGFDVYTLFNANFSGEFTFVNKDQKNDLVKIFFMFPQNTTQVNQVQFKVKDSKGNFIEPDDITINSNSVSKYLKLKYKEKATVKISYIAEGYDNYIYESTGSITSKLFKMKINLKDAQSDFIPENSLQPTQTSNSSFIWDYKNVVTEGKIIVELPSTTSPIGRIILFFKLSGVAVLLFGLGLLYISGLDKPERLDTFRFGHFLLLALTYSLFFINFIVLSLGKEITSITAMIISALFSIPLLMLHVSRAWGISFALTKVLPLAIFTLSIVINGVYGEDFKRYIFLGFLFLIVSFFILTYGTWVQKRKEYLDNKKKIQKNSLSEISSINNKEKDVHSFCVSCGKDSNHSKYCPFCGTIKPINLECSSCGSNYKIPMHILDEKSLEKNLKCSNCGDTYKNNLWFYKIN